MKKLDNKGSHIIYIVILFAVLGMLSVGLMAVVNHNTSASVVNREREQAYQIARGVQINLVKSFLSESSVRKPFAELAEEDDSKIYVSNGETELSNGAVVTTKIEYDYPEKKAYLTTKCRYKNQTQSITTELEGTVTEGISSGEVTTSANSSYIIYGKINTFLPDGSPGNIITGDDFVFNSWAANELVGNITSAGSVEMKNDGRLVDGTITAAGEIRLSGDTQNVTGSLISLSDIYLEDGQDIIDGSVKAAKNVIISGDKKAIGGDLICGEGVYISGKGINVDGGIYTGGYFGIKGYGALISGDVYCGGDFYIEDNVTINGNVYVKGTLTHGKGASTINGNVYASSISAKSLTINGGTIKAVNGASFKNEPKYTAEHITQDELNALYDGGVKKMTADDTKSLNFKPPSGEAVDENGNKIEDIDYQSPQYNIKFEDEFLTGADYGEPVYNEDDIYIKFEVGNSLLEIDKSMIPIEEGKRTFVFFDVTAWGSGSVRLNDVIGVAPTGTGEDKNSGTAGSLFFVCNPNSGKKINFYVDDGTKYYGQIYAPLGYLTMYGKEYDERPKEAWIYGVFNLNSVGIDFYGNRMPVGAELNVYQYQGNYAGTGLDSTGGGAGNDIFGGSGGADGPSSLGWKVKP